MDSYPDPDEEFELMYGDELEIINEHNGDEDYNPVPSKPCNKPLNSNKTSHSTPSTSAPQNLNKTFTESEDLFPELTTAHDTQNTLLNTQNAPSNSQDLFPNAQNSSTSTENRQKTLEELFGDIQDLEEELGLTVSNNRKRTVDASFGNVNDFEYFDVILPDAKKQKLSEREEKFAMIEQILHLRSLSKKKNDLTNVCRNSYVLNTDRDKNNLSLTIPKYPFIGVTRSDRQKVYVRFHSEEFEKEERLRVVKECTFEGIVGDGFKQVWKEAEKLIDKEFSQTVEVPTEEIVISEPTIDSKLWVDLYKPRRYLELLSDESTNRVMLRWIKLWDKVVFNRKVKVKINKKVENSKFKTFKPLELDTTLEEDGRPKYKVALLCGPPGLGKTTLAHMVACHAGYNVVEINASDDRSTECFRAALENATQMLSVVDSKRRPNCLIFDEIDGAPQSSIDFLVKFVTGVVKTKAKKGKNKTQAVLKRPIICICNDVYVPSLRALRQISFVVNFPPISNARLAERLMEIARRQQIKTDLSAMMALAEKSNTDIRTCLSVLHFFKGLNKKVTLSDIYKSGIGQKDVQQGIFEVWQDIFYVQANKHDASIKSRIEKIIQNVSSFGDYNKIGQGVFENYTQLKLKDASLKSVSHCMDWFVFNDLIHKHVYSLQNYTLSVYLPYAFVIWHFNFAIGQRQKLNYPKIGYQATQRENHQRGVITEMLRGIKPQIRSFCNKLSLILDILPLLVFIIVPKFRPVSLHLYTKEEKENMMTVVNIMIDYNLNYVQERLPNGTYTFNLDPNIEEMVIFNKSRLKNKVVSYSNKQLIAREIELEKVRRFESLNKNIHETTKTNETSKIEKKSVPNPLKKIEVKSLTTPEAHSKDFFGRIVSRISPKGKTAKAQQSNDIWYQYKEGYSNAVRKRIIIKSLK